MLDTTRIIEDLETMKRQPQMFVTPVSPESLAVYLSGFERGILLSQNEYSFHDFVEAHKWAMKSKGLLRTAVSAYGELREKGFDENQIVTEMIDIEIEMWRTLPKGLDRGEMV